MLDAYLFSDWDEAPEGMSFETTFSGVLERTADLVARIFGRIEFADRGELPSTDPFYASCLELYYSVPAIVNVVLNYKICVEQGLPLHPTYYFEVKESDRFKAKYPDTMVDRANDLYMEALSVSKSLYALDKTCIVRLRDFMSRVPEIVLSFVYSSGADKYTWRGSEPEKIGKLAKAVEKGGGADIVIGAAHGSIMCGIMLACMLGCDLYFVRFSMFKRNDEKPIVSPRDEEVFASCADSRVLLFDEDIAKGTTLSIFSETLKPYFRQPKTGGVIRHAFAAFKPDYVGVQWFD